MRILDADARRRLTHVALELTPDEVQDLLDALEALRRDPSKARQLQVSSADGQTGLTVWIKWAQS